MEFEKDMQKDWISLMKLIGVSDSLSLDWWSVISRRHSEEWRFYHTLSHVNAMMQLYHQWRERITDLNVVALAIYFHDVVYDPKAKDNETQSILLFEKFAFDCNLSDDIISRVSQLIKATISHSIKNNFDDLDLSLFLDFDLAVLGEEPSRYKTYAKDIRKEYIHMNDELYRIARTKVLQSLLNSPSLYASEEFRMQYEEQARKNMMREICDLEQQVQNPGN